MKGIITIQDPGVQTYLQEKLTDWLVIVTQNPPREINYYPLPTNLTEV